MIDAILEQRGEFLKNGVLLNVLSLRLNSDCLKECLDEAVMWSYIVPDLANFKPILLGMRVIVDDSIADVLIEDNGGNY